jgi:hypothetical protein
MTLNDFFQISVSVFCIVGTIFMITVFVWAIMIRAQLGRLIVKLEEISEIAKSTAGDTKEFVDRTISSLETFKNSIFTFEFIRRVVVEVIDLIRNNKKGGFWAEQKPYLKSKERNKDGQAK